jgi:hypothetical protein
VCTVRISVYCFPNLYQHQYFFAENGCNISLVHYLVLIAFSSFLITNNIDVSCVQTVGLKHAKGLFVLLETNFFTFEAKCIILVNVCPIVESYLKREWLNPTLNVFKPSSNITSPFGLAGDRFAMENSQPSFLSGQVIMVSSQMSKCQRNIIEVDGHCHGKLPLINIAIILRIYL